MNLEHYQSLVIHPSTFRKNVGSAQQGDFLNLGNLNILVSTPLLSGSLLSTFRVLLWLPGRPWFPHSTLISISKSFYLLIFQFLYRQRRKDQSAYKTWIFCSGWQRQVCWLRFFCPWLNGSTRWYSRLYLPYLGLNVHIICWELHNQAHGILPNEQRCPPCYVGANIQLMPAPCNLPLCGLRFVGPCHRLCNCHRSASLRSYVDGIWLSVWSWAVMIKLSVSPLSPALLNQAQLASLSTKDFARPQKIVLALAFPAVLLFSPSLCCPSTSLSMVFELLTKAIFILYCLCFLHENILPSQPHFYKPAKSVFVLLNIITQIDHEAIVRHQSIIIIINNNNII